MKTNHSLFHSALSAITVLVMLAGQAGVQAGGPIMRCANGLPAAWPNGGANIPFNPDRGMLGALDNATAVGQVESAFRVWASVSSATVSYVNAGPLPVDVDANNIFDYFFTPSPDGLNPIIFDQSGEIFEMFFGPGSGVLGFSNPEWVDDDCNILEAYSLLNGAGFSNVSEAFDLMVHEFGHFTGLDHSVVNGQILHNPGQDSSGPGLLNSFGTPNLTNVETMYEYYLGAGSKSSTLEADDVAALADLYPASGFVSGSGTISGVIYAANGTTPLSGIHVIARNPANPFQDAVSAISGDHSTGFQNDPARGNYTLRGLTPGASYVVYTDQLLSGQFSLFTPMLPGAEEFYNGARESNDTATRDDPADFELVPARAGTVTGGINFIFNAPKPGDTLAVGDDGSFELALPFPFEIGGQTFNSVFINANGNLTFGRAEGSTSGSATGFLGGPPRIAGWWTDLNPDAGGKVSFAQSASTFTVYWENVPLYPAEGTNNLSITLSRGSHVELRYGSMDAVYGMAGISSGGAVTSGAETASDLSSFGNQRINLQRQPAMYEVFEGTNDLVGTTLRFNGTHTYNDNWAGHNDSVGSARSIKLPFNSTAIGNYTEIEPVGHDVDYFRFNAKAGDYLLIRVTAGQLDSLLGLFAIQGKQGQLVAQDDDSGPGRLSTLTYKVPANGDYAVAVTTAPDTAFTGAGASGGRYVLDVQVVRPEPNNLLLNGGFELAGLEFWHAAESGDPFIPWSIGQAGDGSGFDMESIQPQEGRYVAWGGFDGCGPMQITLYQDATIPASAPSAVLEWKDRVQWNYFLMIQTLPRTYQVQIRNPATDEVLKVLHIMDTGIANGLGDSGWQTHSVDVSEFKGQAVRVFFLQEIPECNTGPGQYELDEVRLRAQ